MDLEIDTEPEMTAFSAEFNAYMEDFGRVYMAKTKQPPEGVLLIRCLCHWVGNLVAAAPEEFRTDLLSRSDDLIRFCAANPSGFVRTRERPN